MALASSSSSIDVTQVANDSAHESLAARPRRVEAGRLGTYTVLGALCGAMPLPWLPEAIVRRVRGALVHDLSARHSLTLTPEARAILVETNGADGPRSVWHQGVTFAATKVLARLGPFGFLPPVRSALGTYVLGHLFARYLETARTSRSAHIEPDEARRVRRAIDQALIYALTTDARTPPGATTLARDDVRARSERVVDGVLIAIANVPGWLVNRLEAAFDEVLASVRA